MASPQIMLIVSFAVLACGYAFWCNIRIAGKASLIRERLEKHSPEAWSRLNPIARNWNGGQPGIKLLYRTERNRYPGFEQEVSRMLELERKMLLGIGMAVACIGLAIAGTEWWGWRW